MSSSAGRNPIVSDWSLAFQNAATKQVLGEGVGGSDGWSPRFGDVLLERAYLQGQDFVMSGTPPDVFFEVEKNGSTQLYDVSYTMTATTFPAALHTEEDTTKHVITSSDYLTADVGHRNYTGGTFVSKDVMVMLEGRYITGPLAGMGVQIGRRGIVRLFHVNGAMNGLNNIFNLMGVTDATGGGGLGWQSPTDYDGWPVPVPMQIRRLVMYGTVNNPVADPDDNNIECRLYIDDPSASGTADLTVTQSLQVGFGTEFSRQAVGGTRVDSTNTLFLPLQQYRVAGSGAANLIDLSVLLEVEYL